MFSLSHTVFILTDVCLLHGYVQLVDTITGLVLIQKCCAFVTEYSSLRWYFQKQVLKRLWSWEVLAQTYSQNIKYKYQRAQNTDRSPFIICNSYWFFAVLEKSLLTFTTILPGVQLVLLLCRTSVNSDFCWKMWDVHVTHIIFMLYLYFNLRLNHWQLQTIKFSLW